MVWVLISFFIIFIIFNIMLKKPYYEKTSGTGTCTDIQFDNYLREIDAYYNLNRGLLYGDKSHDMPDKWQKTLRSRRDRFVREMAYFLFGIYVLIIAGLLKDTLYGNITIYGADLKILAPFSIVPVAVWLWRRSTYDSLIQGYLYGYVDALEKSISRETKSA